MGWPYEYWGRTVRVNISLPAEVVERMRSLGGRMNWSAVALAAIRAVLEHPDQAETLGTLRAEVQRLRRRLARIRRLTEDER